MTTFGLVHGAYLGSWCWERLVPELEARGHRVLAVDLPCEDPGAGASEYAAAAVEAFAAAGDDLVLVGHSLGGLTIPLVAQARPVREMVFLCAMVPRPGRAHADVQREEPDMVLPGPDGGAHRGADGLVRWHPDAAAGWFFADCTPDVARRAASRLRGQSWRINREVTPLRTWPLIPSRYVIGASDPVIDPAWSHRVAREVLGVEPIVVAAGHSPYLAAPAALAEVLARGT